MSESDRVSETTSAITLDQLAALSDEMAALSRAGVPLHVGLSHLGQDLPGRLGRIATDLAQRLERGQPVDQVLSPDQGIPPAFSALLAAGVRTGRLGLVLEGITSLLRRTLDTRQMVFAALLYPIFIAALAYGLFFLMMTIASPALIGIYRDVAPGSAPLRMLEWIRSTGGYWIPWVPILVLVLLGVWWIRSGQAAVLGRRGLTSASRHSSRRTVRNMVRNERLATFADTLALLMAHEIPLPEAVRLAADSCGDRSLRKSAQTLADRIGQGDSLRDVGQLPGFPSLIVWLLATPMPLTMVVGALRRTAESYRQRSASIYRWLTRYLPMWLTVAIGGTTVLVYAFVLVWPWTRFLTALSGP